MIDRLFAFIVAVYEVWIEAREMQAKSHLKFRNLSE